MASKVQGECRAELARAMLSRTFTRSVFPNALQSYYKNHQFPNFDPRSVQKSVKKPR